MRASGSRARACKVVPPPMVAIRDSRQNSFEARCVGALVPHEALRGGIPGSLLEPFCGYLSPKIDKVS